MNGTSGLLRRVLAAEPPPFALLHRPERTGRHQLDVLTGELCMPDRLADVPVAEEGTEDGQGHEVLTVIPYRQLRERGLDCVDDGAPLIAMLITEQAVVPLHDLLRRIPEVPVRLVDGHFDTDDDTYARTVERIVSDEIGKGAGSNFVLGRRFAGRIADYDLDVARTVFRRLCEQESGAYWTFLIHTGTRTFVGATPERHVSLHDGDAVMNPISGTYRYPEDGPTLAGLMAFLDSHKESDELHMVLDEELKMMARVCDSGGARVLGPRLKEMARLAHTEYLITGRSRRHPLDILSETMFAPTVTGSPLASACRVITRYEPAGRGYYGGVAALIGRDPTGGHRLDSAIMIRTADLDPTGQVRTGVGATLVRHSDPAAEVAETRAKAATLLRAMSTDPGAAARPGPGRRRPLGEHPYVRDLLQRRRRGLAGFWLAATEHPPPTPVSSSRRVLVVDAEDMFTAMIAAQLRSLGLVVTVRRWDEPYSWEADDLVVLGPGPGDPRVADDPRNSHLREAIERLLAGRKPFLAVCLSHQLLSLVLGLDVRRGAVPHQGTQREIELFGENETVGFYNTFAAHSDTDKLDVPGVGLVEVGRDAGTGEVHALRGPGFASLQFHAESVLTRNGPALFAARIDEALA
ncbi:phenazine biosynthesis protein phzE [Streptomyces umbrinus]|uniref:anthranilate synthase n=1 Tax=Streptomyces umbrinus TaxID=67370 RepID=A0ABU0SIC9_9ACTN|nr:anthranilate synthase family protein [Streptomyces umbrinus]MDQ1023309.1 phenazine biosynthesis protein phzE [Streptomyces umbrinus]